MNWQEKLRASVNEAINNRVYHVTPKIDLVGLDDRSGCITTTQLLSIINAVKKAGNK